MLTSVKVRYFVAAFMSITFHAVVHSNRDCNAMLKLLIANEDMQGDMALLKRGDLNWIDGLPQFIQRVRDLKTHAEEVNRGEIPSYDRNYMNDMNALSDELSSKIPDPDAEHPPSKVLYSSVALKFVDQIRRNFLHKSSASRMDYWKAHDSCYFIKLHVDIYLENQNITINHVCTNLDTCSKVARPYNYHHFEDDQDVTQACTSDQKCRLDDALPMMTGMFYSKVIEMAAHHDCCQILSQEEECKRYRKSYDELMHQVNLLLAYAYSQRNFWPSHWNTFFTNAISNNAHVDIDAAFSVMNENKKDFETARTACRILKFPEACTYDNIYKQYEIIQKNKQDRNNPKFIKDLRLHPQMSHAKLIELQNIKINQIEILGSVDKLDNNMQASVSGISTFLGDLAKFDKGIADADAAFIKGELEKYTTSLTDVERKLTEDLQEAMAHMAGVLTASLAEKIAVLAVTIATNTNPLKLVFSGPDLTDIVEQTNDIANAGAELAHGLALIASLESLVWDSFELGEAFIGNSEQISSLESVKDQILNDQENNLNDDADKFLEEYSAYTPQTDRSRLAHNNALWSAFKDSTCDLLTIDVGVVGSVVKGIATGQLLCERLEGTLAQFFTLREDIFDFQFQLVDATAGVVRGNMAYQLAQDIKGKEDAVNGAELMISFFMTQSNLQAVASSYCNTIEYKQLGKLFSGCSTFDGFFRKENLDALVSYTASTATYHELTRYVTIPTQSSYPGDTAYVDLNALAKGNEVVLKLPKNSTWLQDHRWTIPGHGETKVPFVKSFEIYLPHKSYESGSIPTQSTMEITIKSIAGSSITTLNPNTGIIYVLPRESGTYLTVYEENYSKCPKEIENPYSLCDNLPNLCMLSSRHPREDALLPTILSTWSIRLKRSQGSKKLTWDAPHPATGLMLSAKVVLRAPSSQRKRIHLSKLMARSDVVESKNGCCEGNRYRMSRSNHKCITCPERSTALLRGLYCEIDKESKE